MKRILAVLIALLPLINFAQDVQFFQGTWEEVNAKAKAENKLIFVDAYTYWCGPCKMMDETMFHNNKEVADYVNAHFIAYKVECEHDFGVEFARKYKVNVYPTMLMFNSSGQLLEKHLGYNDVQSEFIETFRKVVNMDQTDVYAMDPAKIKMNWPEFYAKNFKDANDPTWKRDKSVDPNIWLDQQTDLFNEVSWAVMYIFNTNEKYSKFFLDNYETYKAKYKFEAQDEINNIIYGFMNTAVKENKPELMTSAENLMQKYFPEDTSGLFYLRLNYMMSVGDNNGLANLMSNYIATNKEVYLGTVNAAAWNLYENCDDQKILQTAISWFQPYLPTITDYFAMDTYAALLYKTKQYASAEEWAIKASALGKADGEDMAGTEELLEKIKKEK